MLTVTAENVAEFVLRFKPLRAAADAPTLTEHDAAARAVVGSCCNYTTHVFLGAFTIPGEDGRVKELYACPCCRQVFKDDPGTPVQGKIEEYFANLVRKHGSFNAILNSEAAKLGARAAHS